MEGDTKGFSRLISLPKETINNLLRFTFEIINNFSAKIDLYEKLFSKKAYNTTINNYYSFYHHTGRFLKCPKVWRIETVK